MAETNLNIIRDVSCWLDLNESDGQILKDTCGRKGGMTITRRSLWLHFFSRLRMPVNTTVRYT